MMRAGYLLGFRRNVLPLKTKLQWYRNARRLSNAAFENYYNNTKGKKFTLTMKLCLDALERVT